MREYTVHHCHSTMSNDTYFDSVTNFEDYLKVARKRGIKAISFSEHGNVMQWIKKKQIADENNVKYIHGSEFYLAFDLQKQERQTYHIGLYAKNYEGVKEINKLSSISFDGRGEKWYPGIQYYYRPRISFDQLKQTSDNIIITTACLASPIWRLRGTEIYDEYMGWLEENNHRVFLEVQPHVNCEDQKTYNRLLLEESKKRSIKIIAGSDTHVLDKIDNRLRDVLQKGRKTSIDEDEEGFALHLRTYDELEEEFKLQGVLNDTQIHEAIENTNLLCDMCEEWEIDKSHKYPKISKNPKQELWNRIDDGIKRRGVYSLPQSERDQYLEKIKFEYQTYIDMGMCDYIILLDDIIRFCRDNNISTSPRGSCNGSQSLWAMGITDVDPIKYGTLFFRFVNPNRVSLGDVDIDMAGSMRPYVKDYLYNREDLQSSAIVTYSKLALRGACRMVAKGLGYDLELEDEVAKDIEEITVEHEDETTETISTFHNKEKWEKLYPEWIELTYRAQGIIQNTSVHACGFVAFDGDIQEEIGVFRNKNSKWVISQNDMKAIDSVNFVKMDFLVVDNVQIISDTEKLANVDLGNDNLNLEDDNVWNEMLKSGLGIFQFEQSGWYSLRKALENYDKFTKHNKDITRYFIMLALNGVIRPSCASFREEFLNGVPNDNGHVAINNFFSNMNQYCIFQEQLMLFLEKFCHYTGAQSDTLRRAISKKGGTEKYLPEIRESFMEHFLVDYDATQEQAETAIEKFLVIIDNASRYGFSINHSTPYTLNGYKNAYLRHYHTLEYLTVQLNVNDGKLKKTSGIIQFMKDHTDIKLNGIKFGKSSSKYTFDKEENAIYKGIGSIKNMGKKDGDELYELRHNTYNTFTETLDDIKHKTSVNKGKLLQLIKLGFFDQYGAGKKLEQIVELYFRWHSKKTAKFYNKTTSEHLDLPFAEELFNKYSEKKTACQYSGVDYVSIIKECEQYLDDEDYTLKEKIQFQKEYLGYVNLTDPSLSNRTVLVNNLNTKYSPKADFYCLKNGKSEIMKVKRKPKRRQLNVDYFEDKPFKEGDILYAKKVERKRRMKKVDDDWIYMDEFDYWLLQYNIVE